MAVVKAGFSGRSQKTLAKALALALRSVGAMQKAVQQRRNQKGK